MGRKWIWAIVLGSLLVVSAPSRGQSARRIEQYGVTFAFDRAYQYGTFANGDYWVLTGDDGTVTIREITPQFDGQHHGWEVDPAHTGKQGFDERVSGFDASRVPELPYEASPGESLVKVVSVDLGEQNPRPALKTAVVLTVLGEEPPDGGESVFRPPYFGHEKPLYSVEDLNPEKLPSLSVPDIQHLPSLEWVEQKFQRVWLDHKQGWTGRAMHPADNMPDYGSGIARDTGQGALRLMLGEPADEKMPALVNYVQLGIDLYHMRKGGQRWPPNGGHCSGRKLPIAFAGVLFEHEGMKAAVSEAEPTVFQEDSSVYYSPTAKMTLWGQPGPERMYWSRLCGGSGSKTVKDPYGYIDGGQRPGGSYQACCNSRTWKGTVLALHLMPELREVWNYEPFLDYEDRWVNFGAWTQPDPYALDCQNRGAKDTNREDGVGRFPDLHGTNADGGGWGSRFADEMWAALRPGDAAGMPAIEPYGGEFEGSVEVTLSPSPRTPDCEIRYTTDGSEPTEESPLYEGRFELSETATVKARAFSEGLYDSAVNSARFERE